MKENMARHKSDKLYKLRNVTGRCISVEFSHIPGKRISTGTKDMTEAILFAEEYLMNDGIQIEKDMMTFKQYADNFFMRTDARSFHARNEAFKKKRGPTFYKKHQALLDNYIMPQWGNYLIASITPSMIESWILTYKGINGKQHADATKNKTLQCLNHIMESAKKEGIIDINPVDTVTAITAESSERRPLTTDEQQTLFPLDAKARIDIWEDLMWATYFSVFYDTGFRPGEIAGLRVCDVYRTPSGLAVSTTQSVNSEVMEIATRVKTSGKGMERRVGLLDSITEELLLQLVESKKNPKDLLFVPPKSKKFKVLSASSSNKHFKQICKKMGLDDEGLVQYCLRHTYETERRGDLDDSMLAITMGHTKLRDDYDHRAATEMIRILEKNRNNLFENRRRREEKEMIVPISKLK